MNMCPICNGRLDEGLADWHLVCAACGYEGSTLTVQILEQQPEGDLDETAREDALAPLRHENFTRLASEVSQRAKRGGPRSARPRLLDVGCAHGWFLEATQQDFDGLGIEPDRAVAAATALRGLPVRGGFFPEVLDPEERFDVIVFNDVLEHIPDVNGVLDACYRHLVPGGLLVVNAPSRSGILYRVSKWLSRLGRRASFERMWQKGFPSPHIHYFHTPTIERLARGHGFEPTGAHRLRSVSTAGLYDRVRYSRDVSPLKAALTTAIVATAVPLLPLLPADIQVWYLTRDDRR